MTLLATQGRSSFFFFFFFLGGGGVYLGCVGLILFQNKKMRPSFVTILFYRDFQPFKLNIDQNFFINIAKQ